MKHPSALFPLSVNRGFSLYLRPVAFAYALTTASVCMVCGGAGVAHAQVDPSAADVESARAAFLQGLDLRDRVHDNSAAISKFKAAYSLVATPKIGFELGKTYRIQGDLVSARDAFLAVDRIPPRKNESADAHKAREDAAAQATDLDAKIPSLTITVVGAGQVSVDGQLVRKDALAAPRRLNPGPHVVQFLVEGEAKDQRVVELHEGEQKSVSFNGPATGPTTKPVPLANTGNGGTEWKPGNGNGDSTWKPPGYNTKPNPARPILLTVAGLTAGAGAVFGIVSITAVTTAKADCNESGVCSGDFASHKSKAMTLSIVADVCFGVALVTGIIGLVLPRTIQDTGTEVGFSPMPGGGYLSAGGRF
ncbi:hypothetical protein BH09MYX1_BH09MYX1_44190 [soil metagenome]